MIIPYTFMLFNEVKAGTGQQPYWVYGLAIVIGISMLFWSILTWWKDTYQLEHSALLIQKEVFNTSQRVIPLERITNISMKSAWVDRVVGIDNLRIADF